MKKILKAILAGLIATICIVMFLMAGYALVYVAKEACEEEDIMILVIFGVVLIIGSVMFNKGDY